MLSAEIAFRSDEPLRALVLLSPTIVDEASWRSGFASRKGLPVFLAHGRQDPILPFASSARLAQALSEAGLRVTWVPFDGGHDIPSEVVSALNRFLDTYAAP
jgi:phospholipase/carboxylesterase